MNNITEELKESIIGKVFIAKKTGIEGEILDIDSRNIYIEIDLPGPIPLSINRYKEFIDIDENIKEKIDKYRILSRKRKK